MLVLIKEVNRLNGWGQLTANGHVTKPLQNRLLIKRISNNMKFSGENGDYIFKIGRLFIESRLSIIQLIATVIRRSKSD